MGPNFHETTSKLPQFGAIAVAMSHTAAHQPSTELNTMFDMHENSSRPRLPQTSQADITNVKIKHSRKESTCSLAETESSQQPDYVVTNRLPSSRNDENNVTSSLSETMGQQ